MKLVLSLVTFIALIFESALTQVAAQTLWVNHQDSGSAIPFESNNQLAADRDPLQTLAQTLRQWQTQLSLEPKTRKRGAEKAL